jgi:hypothetical protein
VTTWNTQPDPINGVPLTSPLLLLTTGDPPATTILSEQYIDLTNPDGAGVTQVVSHIPASVNMTGGAAVQGCGLIFDWDSSAATPNSGLAETDMIRFIADVNSNAGSKLQVNLLSGLLTVANDEAGSGNEDAGIILTTRATGPTSGTAAVGIWGGDLHVEKATSVLDGSMVGLEVGIHKAPALSTAKCRGIDIWSGDRSGITASRAGDAIYVHGNSGWTNFIRLIHTDDTSEVWKIDQNGTLTATAPTGNITSLFQTNVNSSVATLQAVGRTSGAVSVSGFLQADGAGQVSIGTTSVHPVVFQVNNAEVFRIPTSGDGLLKTIAGLESTGATTATLGTASPATVTTPYTWIKMRSSDNTIVYFPVWK